MGITESLRLSLEGLRANKMRAVLTMLGIIIGIAAVIGILTVGDGLSGSITGTLSSMGASSITISLQERDKENASTGMGALMGVSGGASDIDGDNLITADMISEMSEQYADDIAGISLSESVGSGQAKDGRLYANVSITGVNADYFAVNDTDVLKGRLLKENDEADGRMICVVSDKLVNNMFDGDFDVALGSQISVELNKERLRFRIVGVYEYEASSMTVSQVTHWNCASRSPLTMAYAAARRWACDGMLSTLRKRPYPFLIK